jgi:hypothetical protein
MLHKSQDIGVLPEESFGNSVSTGGDPLVRVADYSSKWKVPHWKSVNTSAFMRTKSAKKWPT